MRQLALRLAENKAIGPPRISTFCLRRLIVDARIQKLLKRHRWTDDTAVTSARSDRGDSDHTGRLLVRIILLQPAALPMVISSPHVADPRSTRETGTLSGKLVV